MKRFHLQLIRLFLKQVALFFATNMEFALMLACAEKLINSALQQMHSVERNSNISEKAIAFPIVFDNRI